MPKFYTIMLNFAGEPKQVHPAEFEAALYPAVAVDWLRYADYQYIVASNHSADQIFNAVKPSLPAGAFIVVLGVDMRDRAGWTSQLVIDWFVKHSP